MTTNQDQAAIDRCHAEFLETATSLIEVEGQVDPVLIASMSAALFLISKVMGGPKLAEWLRNMADTIEQSALAAMGPLVIGKHRPDA